MKPFPGSYNFLSKQSFTDGEYAIVPIRIEDRKAIMEWRNEQIYHLRQARALTEQDQDIYFNQVVRGLFSEKKPKQILFSVLKGEECIGYGGLVHINWIDQHAEVSFIMETELETEHFNSILSAYLPLIEEVAFQELNLHKLFEIYIIIFLLLLDP